MPLTRRHVLAIGALTAAAAAVGAGGVALHWWNQPAGNDYRSVSSDEGRFLRAFAGTIFPATEAIPLDGASADLDHFIDESMILLDPTMQKLTRVLFHALDGWTLPTQMAPFHALSYTARAEVVDGWLNHANWATRQGVLGLVLLLGMGYTIHPSVAPFFSRMHGCGYGA